MDYDYETQLETMGMHALAQNSDIEAAHYDIIHWNDISKEHQPIWIQVHCPVTISRDRPNFSGAVDLAMLVIGVFARRTADQTGALVNVARGWCRKTFKRRDLMGLLNSAGQDLQVAGGPNAIQMVGSENVNTNLELWQRNITMEMPVALDLGGPTG